MREKNYLALAFVQTESTEQIEFTTIGILRQHLADPFSGGRKKSLERRKLHYSDANEDLRKAYVDKLSILPFRAYLVFGELKSPKEYESLYLELIQNLLPHRLMGCDQAIVRLIFEENSKIKGSSIVDTINKLHQNLACSDNRRPIFVETIIGGKSDYPCFSAPDFLLAIFSAYAKSNSDPNERRALFFEKLRDKIRVILDADKEIVYTRKRPYEPWQ